ncbi:MAG TPA: 4a-hydroxytetrahydrobiopterin dehydratase [Planctomycetota bacterium]
MSQLASKKCVPCSKGTKKLSEEEVRNLLQEVPEWKLGPNKDRIAREFGFPEFAPAMVFVNQVAALAEEEGHHPDFHVHYNKVKLVLWTHAIGGLHDNDFVMAARIDRLAP